MNDIIQDLEVNATNGKENFCYISEKQLNAMKELYKREAKEIKQLQQENKQLKDNWNKLREFIVKEYYMYLPLEASTKSITILTDKMQELEQGIDINVKD